MQLAMSNIKNQLAVLEARKNIRLTWKKKMDLAKVDDPNQPLTVGYEDYPSKPIKGSLYDPTAPFVALCNFLYQEETFVYPELNRASRFKDRSKIATIGPFAAAFG